MLLGGVRLHFGCRLSDVRIDADHSDALGFVILGELFHPLVVAVGYRAARRDENNDRTVFARQRFERMLGTVSVRQFEIVNHRANRRRRRQIARVATAAGNCRQGNHQKRRQQE